VKIAFALSATDLSGGAKVLLEHAQRLARRGHDTVLVLPEGKEPPFPFEGARARSVPGGCDLLVATRYHDVPRLVELGRPVAHLIQGDDTAGPRAALATPGLGGFLARRRAEAKLEKVAAILALPTAKVAVARHLVARLVAAGHRALLAPNGVDLERFSPGRLPEPAKPRVLIAGPRQGPTKGIALALAALDLVRADQTIEVVHLAPTKEGTDPLADTRASGLDEAGVAALLRTISVFVSAVTEDEGFDLVALEAMASGVPCVLSGGGAHREVAPDLVAGPDPGALAAAVVRVLAHPGERVRRIEKGLAAARARSWETAIVEVDRAYLAALSVARGDTLPPD
jgi:glycosyltransferase involved in cell wall biosynthesis